jgi:multicomponent K+:H+ antiporter subunit E
VVVDILRSNFNVARIVLGLAGKREISSGFVNVPLALRDPHGLATLAAIVTATPGTVWADLSDDGNTLTLHVLDLTSEAEWVNTIKQRYESLLMEIYE